jgi:hypothetical protein
MIVDDCDASLDESLMGRGSGGTGEVRPDDRGPAATPEDVGLEYEVRMDARRQAAVARALIDHDSRTPLQFKPADTNVVAGASGREVEGAFSDMEDDGWIEGSRAKVGDTIVWSDLRMTAVALQDLHEWPPPGREHERGPWTTKTWGQRDLPLLKALAENPPRGRFLSEPVMREPRERSAEWNGYLRLLEAGLIYGVRKQEGLERVQITEAGRAALVPQD